MGYFKDVRTLQRQGEALRAQAPAMRDRMAALSAQMAGQVASGAVASSGAPATATIIGARQTGAMLNFNPVVELELLVMMPNGVPMPAVRDEVVMQIHLARCQPGVRLNVKVDPGDVRSLWIDWATPVG